MAIRMRSAHSGRGGLSSVVHQRRHAPVSRPRRTARPAAGAARARGPLQRLSRGAEGIFSQDHGDRRRGGRFRWFVSTCFAAGIGAFAILFALLGANDQGGSLLPAGGIAAAVTVTPLQTASDNSGLRWALPKADKLVATSGAMSTKFIIYDSVRQQRDKREYLQKKTYARIVSRLAAAPSGDSEKLPPFNPYKLYANEDDSTSKDALAAVEQQEAQVRVVELLGGILPSDDGQDMNTPEVSDVVARDTVQADAVALKPGFQVDGAEKAGVPELLAQRSAAAAPEVLPPNTTALAKVAVEADDTVDDLEPREVRVFRAGRGDTLTKILSKLGGEALLAGEMVQAAKDVFADTALLPGHEVHVTLVASLTKPGASEPVRFSVFADGHVHKVTVTRKSDGDFAASSSPIDERIVRAAVGLGDKVSAASLYASFYMAALSQGLPAETIQQVLKIHASESDFRRRVQGADVSELFFDVKEEGKGADGALGDLLATSLTSGGETQKYYRFRSVDGLVDYYDEYGNNSRKFLMRRPVRGEGIRLADRFGWRRHPLLGYVRRHAGIDWAGPAGTPIMAAGAGVIEEARFKGEFGNYIRIRHANGYQTAYAHMSRFGAGVAQGARVTQGQVIGAIGSTGLSTGPHLHFEVLVNTQPVDPMSIPVPKERKLAGKAMADFQKERARIDDLMRRNPVSTKVVDATPVR
jgi:murein DD-endopeptidase MepM/ murein hydrolase activator NlpD